MHAKQRFAAHLRIPAATAAGDGGSHRRWRAERDAAAATGVRLGRRRPPSSVPVRDRRRRRHQLLHADRSETQRPGALVRIRKR